MGIYIDIFPIVCSVNTQDVYQVMGYNEYLYVWIYDSKLLHHRICIIQHMTMNR